MKRSMRELWRAIEDLAPDGSHEFNIQSEVVTVMDRETAETEGREVVGDVDDVRMVEVADGEGQVVYQSPQTAAPGVDLVEVDPEEARSP